MITRIALRAAVALALALTPRLALAESPELPDANYRNLRYEDDVKKLAELAKSGDPWGKLKAIPIADSAWGPTYLSLGGEWRERMESYVHQNFGFKAPPTDTYLLQRVQVNADLHVTDYFRAFAQFSQDERFGARGVNSTTDIDRGDLTQAFLDVRAPSPLGDAPVLRAGREELLFGFQRLVAVREGPNVRRSFDGFRVSDSWGGATLDLIDVRPVSNLPGTMDDSPNKAQQLWGGYLTVPIGSVTKADLYGLGYDNSAGKYRGVTGQEHRDTWGVRLFGAAKGFDWNMEAASQTGTFAGRQIRASMLAGILGYTFAGLPFTPRIGVSANYASGDNAHGATIGTFNAMYPRLPYFAETSQLVPANVKDIRPLLTFEPVKDVQAVFGWDALWRASTTDSLYGSGMVAYANTNSAKVTGSWIGSETTADVRWRVDEHLSVGAIAARFAVGPALQQAAGLSENFYVLYAKYKF